MSRQARAVIGAGYGDEGKGLMTDFHASQGADVVVRYNGGAQAGHTVATPDGRRHVFHHVGSGAFVGVPTHLSRFFILNPIFLRTEMRDLQALGVNPALSADPSALVTTPFDMIINQIAETVRGNARHGSCGLGIGETVERNLRTDLALSFDDLSKGSNFLHDKLRLIRATWIESRLQTLGVGAVPEPFREALASDGLIERFVDECGDFLNIVGRTEDRDVAGDIVFEGAQGLLLDQDYGAFPYVTRSNTGLKNIVSFCEDAGIDHVDVTYATRCYVTRHGAGPLAHSTISTDGLFSIVDETNAPNAWQGTIRSAPLDVDVLRSAIEFDLGLANSAVSAKARLSVSCLDQINEGYMFVSDGQLLPVKGDVGAAIAAATGITVGFQSFGPTRDTIRKSWTDLQRPLLMRA